MLPSFTTSPESVQISEAPKETKGGYAAGAAGSAGATGSGAFEVAGCCQFGLTKQSIHFACHRGCLELLLIMKCVNLRGSTNETSEACNKYQG
jgi:hypothetical protein